MSYLVNVRLTETSVKNPKWLKNILQKQGRATFIISISEYTNGTFVQVAY